MNYKIVFFDVDGTLINDDGKMPPSALKAIQQLQRKGILVVLATGRPAYLAEKLAKELNIFTYICFNGGLMVHEGETIYEKVFDKETVHQMKKIEKRVKCVPAYFSKNNLHTTWKQAWFVRFLFWYIKEPHPPFTLKTPTTRPIYTSFVYGTSEIDEEFMKLKDVKCYRWNKRAVEIAPSSCTKATAMEILLHKLNIDPSETIAFGDNINDLEMLQYAGLGVAMENGTDDAKACADMICKSVDEDGIYETLKQLKLIDEVEE